MQKQEKIQKTIKYEPSILVIKQLQDIQIKTKQILSKNPQDILNWYISQIILKDTKYPKITLYKKCKTWIERYLQNQKYTNLLFLQDQSIIKIINSCKTLLDIGFVLKQYLNKKTLMKQIKYTKNIYQVLQKKIKQLFYNAQTNDIDLQFRTNYTSAFLDMKKATPKQLFKGIDQYCYQQLSQQVYIIYYYVLKPIIKFSSLKLLEHLYRITQWLIIVSDQSQEGQNFVYDLSLDIRSQLCSPLSESNFNLIQTFNLLMDILAVRYQKEDFFKYLGLAPLLNSLKEAPFRELIGHWITSKGKGRVQGTQIQNIFRNCLHTGSKIFTFYLIDNFSRYLHSISEYNILFHLFEFFIKKDYIRFNLPNKTFVSTYLETIYFYAIGFINRDRLDGQTQLDQLTNNIQRLIFREDFSFEKFAQKIVLFYRIYQNRFLCLSKNTKKFMENLQNIYRISISVVQIHNTVSSYIFSQAGMDLPDYCYQLKKSDRYLGITNMGNLCYMSSFIQALYMTKKFKALILQARDQAKLPRALIKTHALINFFNQLSNVTYFGSRQVDPIIFKTTTPQPFASQWDQHDSGQFGRIYLDHLTTQLKNQPLKQKIQRLFYHKIIIKIICKQCNQVKQKAQYLLDFILNINKSQDSINLSELLRRYFMGQQLDLNNKLYCQRCKKKTQVISLPQPQQFAQYLIATISIFQYSGQGQKIIKPFNIEFNINFKNILPQLHLQDIQYTLYAFIVHLGQKSQRGHYVCYARNLQENPMIWYLFDDGYVTERQISKASDFKFGQLQTPYIMFYSSADKNRVSLKDPKSPSKLSLLKIPSMVSR